MTASAVGRGRVTQGRVSALLRYQLSLLLRSQRWLPPVLFYALLLVAGWFGGQQYGDSLGWCAGMLVPVCAWLTRTATSAEPDAARSVVAAAVGARTARGAMLAVALGCGLLLGAVGGAFEVATSSAPIGPHAPIATIVQDGLVAVLVGVLAGTALGALPIRGRAAGALALTAGSLGLLVLAGSPVNAAVRQTFTSGQLYAVTSLPWLALVEAVALLAVCAVVAVRAESS
ncbi:hypothetical protein ABIA32_003998 [Streptacidiphilus sp. MAP12-20]|uniref:hypothetical protein n=1 Tax=Streptacidiphilus sp. MAP12-20 TaxID=3156299 RepID=UPI0035129EB7